MSLLVVQLLSGLANAMFLFLIASGLSLIFGVTRIVNFAHGSFYMLAAYLTYSLSALLPLGAGAFYAAALLAALLVAGLGGLVEALLLRRVYRAPELYQLLLTFALVLIVADAVRYLWGADNKTGPAAPGLAGSVPIAGQLFPSYDLAVIVFGPLVALGLWALFHRTRWGILIRAATQDREMVAALGVDQSRLFTGVFIIGSFLAGLAGALQVPRLALTTVMDTTVIVEAFVVVVIGGMGSVWGALLASLLIGVLNAFGVLVLPKISIVLIFVVMAVVLIVRPWGLLGRPEIQHRAAGAGAVAEVRVAVASRRWLGAGILLLAALPWALPTFWVWLVVEIFTFVLFAASLHLLMGLGGMVSFGHAAYFGIGAYAAALLLQLAGWPMPLAFMAAPWWRGWPPSSSATSASGSRAFTSPCSPSPSPRSSTPSSINGTRSREATTVSSPCGLPPGWRPRRATTTGRSRPRSAEWSYSAWSPRRPSASPCGPCVIMPGARRPSASTYACCSGRPSSWRASWPASAGPSSPFSRGASFPSTRRLPRRCSRS